ncbi:MAG: alpha/beta fold hydrolase [Flavobacteriaceae bacterium]|nr:alpha/beta fold hydrolase [Flavobacteriaceae bacterium]
MIKEINLVLDGPNGRPLVVDYFLPEQGKEMPILIFCHGYKGFKDWGPWNVMSESLANSGIAVIKFNFSFNGGTVSQPIDFPDLEAFGNNNYSKEVEDLVAILNFVFADSRFDIVNRDHICVMGHSRGGGIAALAAAEDERIKLLITLAGVSDFEARFNMGSEEFKAWERSGVKYIMNGRTKQEMPHYFQFYQDYEKNADKLNIESAVRSMEKSHLIIHGDADEAVNVKEAYNMASWNPEAQLHIIKDANHVFGTSHPWTEENLSKHMENAIEHIIEYIKNN